MVVFDTGAADNLACFRWLGNRNLLVGKHGFTRASAAFFGDGRVGEVRSAADITVGSAGR